MMLAEQVSEVGLAGRRSWLAGRTTTDKLSRQKERPTARAERPFARDGAR